MPTLYNQLYRYDINNNNNNNKSNYIKNLLILGWLKRFLERLSFEVVKLKFIPARVCLGEILFTLFACLTYVP